MPPKKSNENKNNAPPPPPHQYDPVVFQAVVTVIVIVVMTQIRASDIGGLGNGTNSSNHGHTRECSYKDFMTCGPKSFDGSGGVIALM